MIENAKASIIQSKRFVLKRDIILALVVALTVIAVGVFMGWYNNKVVPPNPAATAHYNQEPNNPLSFMSNWDGPDYLRIAQNGYTNFDQTNFFPLYPLAIKVVHVIISSSLISALLISWASLVGAIYFYLKIIKNLFGVAKNEEALRGLLPFILFPTAIFFLATYTEALFAFLALGAIYFALRRNYLAAGAFLLPTTATHVTGILVWVLVILILLEQKLQITKVIVTGVIGGLGLLAYMVFLQLSFHDFLGFITSQKGHGWLKNSYLDIITQARFLNIIFIILLVLAAVYWWKRRKSFSIYSLLFLLIPIIGRQYGGFNRYVLMAFPLPLMLYGYLRNKKLGYSLVLVLSSILWAYFLFQYAGGYVGG
jgi:hypothetical protein